MDPKPMTGEISSCGLGQGLVANDRIKGQAKCEESDDQPRERAIGLARKDPDFPHQVAERHDNEYRRDNLKQKVELRDHDATFFP